MSMKRLVAIGLIFLLACVGWGILGQTTSLRSANSSRELGDRVETLYGSPLVQPAPSFALDSTSASQSQQWLMPAHSEIRADLQTDYRKKGLVWFPTYRCAFDSSYTLANTEKTPRRIRLHFTFPAKSGAYYDNFVIAVDQKPLALAPGDAQQGIEAAIDLGAGECKTVRIGYNTRGVAEWRYQLDPHLGRAQNMNLVVRTDFRNFDYPDGSFSATSAVKSDSGMLLTWKIADLITTQEIGVVIPEKLNPGPLTSRITFFAPVCLLFFFILVLTIHIHYRIAIHPMHYLFVAAGFFAFHLLLVYLAGVFNIHLSFIIAAAASMALVTSYLSAALKGKFPWKMALGGQFFFMVLFSYSFFLKGITGLTVAIGSVMILALLMRVTADVDWSTFFSQWNGKESSLFGVPGGKPVPEVTGQ